jgi:hypothetical protein
MTREEKVANYRARARWDRELAERATLQNQKTMHVRAAEVWDSEAEKVELTEHLRIKNDAAVEERRSIYKRRRDESS